MAGKRRTLLECVHAVGRSPSPLPCLGCDSIWWVLFSLLSHVRLFATPWTAAHQASLSFTISWNWFELMSIESEMPYNHLDFCRPLLLLPSIFPSIRVFSNELALHIRWPKYWRFSFSIWYLSRFLQVSACSCPFCKTL